MIRSELNVFSRASLLTLVTVVALAGCDQPSTAPATDASVSAETGVDAPTPPAVSDADVPPTTLVELDEVERSANTRALGLCSFDAINGEPFGDAPFRVDDAASFVVSGWVGDKRTMSRPEATLRIAQVNGARIWAIGVGPSMSRGDVARHFDDEGLADAGFEVSADLSMLPPGEYALSLTHENGDQLVECDKGALIVLSI